MLGFVDDLSDLQFAALTFVLIIGLFLAAVAVANAHDAKVARRRAEAFDQDHGTELPRRDFSRPVPTTKRTERR